MIYYFWVAPDIVYLADVYSKNRKENLTDADKESLKRLAGEIRKTLEA